jgi:hypothetical protein
MSLLLSEPEDGRVCNCTEPCRPTRRRVKPSNSALISSVSQSSGPLIGAAFSTTPPATLKLLLFQMETAVHFFGFRISSSQQFKEWIENKRRNRRPLSMGTH